EDPESAVLRLVDPQPLGLLSLAPVDIANWSRDCRVPDSLAPLGRPGPAGGDRPSGRVAGLSVDRAAGRRGIAPPPGRQWTDCRSREDSPGWSMAGSWAGCFAGSWAWLANAARALVPRPR